MLQPTFLIALLAGSAFAAPLAAGSVQTTTECSSSASSTPIEKGYGPTLASQPVYTAPPTAGSPTTSASITRSPVPSASVPANGDLPASHWSYPFSSTAAWNPALFSVGLAFTETIATPLMSILPVYPITPIISVPTAAPGLPSSPPPIETPCSEEESQKTHTPLHTTTSADLPTHPTGTATRPTGPHLPSGTGRPSEHKGEGYGYGRPRPSDKWPSKHRPSGGLYHSKRPVPSSTPCTEETMAVSTMKTSVRSTPTAGGY
ncbi:hypothetical protein GMOD_00005379 [Pyrenophora seminiperda CCB06]|uniref:Uncharacterized protein n=1 Tax=Pyrenophora seminiperda CCB06 TaxID=1302712 RepID=A0A3M7LVP7_9PLEO|nr:hypothetical protein GMOD_00005379 [Pyrenophora seminiperda CCB06]